MGDQIPIEMNKPKKSIDTSG